MKTATATYRRCDSCNKLEGLEGVTISTIGTCNECWLDGIKSQGDGGPNLDDQADRDEFRMLLPAGHVCPEIDRMRDYCNEIDAAWDLRVAGKINLAEWHENNAENAYKSLPEWLRW